MGSRNDTMASLIIIPFASPAPVFARLPYPVGPGGRGEGDLVREVIIQKTVQTN